MFCRCLSVFRLWLAAVVCTAGPFVFADDEPETQSEPSLEPFVRITQGGLMRYADEAWGVMQATAYNRGTEPVDVDGVAWFASDPGLQFSRRFQLPPGSSRTVWMPILTPKLPPGAKALDLHWATIRKDGSLISNRQGERLSDSPIRVPKSRLVIAYVTGREKRHAEARELLQSIRKEFGVDVMVQNLSSPPFPPTREAWDIAGIVAVATDELVNDAAALNALRLWTQAGGRLWLQLDQIQPETVMALLGDALPFEEIDRTSTVDVEMAPGEDSRDFRPQRAGFERPVPYVRVVVEPPAAVHQRLDGWPAAFSFVYGSGKVFCTTADMSAWFHPRHWRRHEEIAGARNSQWYDTSDAGLLVVQEVALLKEPAVTRDALTDYVVSQVGYTTPKRSSVAGLLVGFAVALCVISLGLRFRQKSGWMLCAIPVLALAASVGLVAVGQAARGEPHGRVLAQVVESEPGQTVASVTEALTYYADETMPLDETVTSGAPLIPDRTGVASSRWRAEWTGVDQWALKGVELPPGVRVATNRTHLEFEEPLRATATFDSNGVTGQVLLPDGFRVEDALIGGSARVTVPVSNNTDNSFTAGEAVLPPGEYLASSLLDNEQSRRQSVYRDVFRIKGRNRPALLSTHLLFWSQPVLPGSGEVAVRDEVGSSLFMIPLELQRPAEAGEILIPGPFLEYRSAPMTKTGGVPAYFNNRTGEWSEYQRASRVLLRFQIPPTVLPVTPASATLTIKLSAGSRQVTIQHGPPGDLVEADKLDSPVGTFDIPLEFGDRNVLDKAGGLHVLLEVGDVNSDDESSVSSDGLAEVKDEYWKVDWISLALRARVDGSDSTDGK